MTTISNQHSSTSETIGFADIEVIDWKKGGGFVPAIVQDNKTGQVLMLGFCTAESLQKTIETGRATFWSRTRKSLWTKGETSGNYLNVASISIDCDNDTLLMLVEPSGPTCHLGTTSCFAEAAIADATSLMKLNQVIAERKSSDKRNNGSYTAQLFGSGTDRIAQKVGEEAVEVAIAAASRRDDELINESGDLLYHLVVLLQSRNMDLSDLARLLESRRMP